MSQEPSEILVEILDEETPHWLCLGKVIDQSGVESGEEIAQDEEW